MLLSMTSLIGACGAMKEVDDSSETGFYQIDGRDMQWPTESTVEFQFSKAFPYEQRPAIAAAANSYNDLLANMRLHLDADQENAPEFTEAQTVDAASNLSGDNVNGVYWLEEPWPWSETSPDSDAMTLVKFDGEKIVEADVYFRARSFESRGTLALAQSEDRPDPTLETPVFKPQAAPVGAQWSYVIGIHEFGHALGRVHAHREDSIMYKTVGLDSLKAPFTSYDREIFSSIYSLR